MSFHKKHDLYNDDFLFETMFTWTIAEKHKHYQTVGRMHVLI